MDTARDFLEDIWTDLGGRREDGNTVAIEGTGGLPSAFAVTDFAVASIGTAALFVAELIGEAFGERPGVVVDRRLASMWFDMTLKPEGWTLPSLWDPVAGNYETRDGWIRLHTNAPHHRAAALAVLGVGPDRAAIRAAVRGWYQDDLETAIIAQGGCAAAMYSPEAWRDHPQGKSVAKEPLVWMEAGATGGDFGWQPERSRPLMGVKVLDLTRVLAGPVATRLLAGFGAEVLRIDPPSWDEPGVVPEVTLGKRCARLDLKTAHGRSRFEALLRGADVVVHGYRPDALTTLGFDPATRQSIHPGLIDVSLDAYGWTGPWAARRGFDSLVQMSCGIALAGARQFGSDQPRPLPVQALDHATGYVLAATVARGLRERLKTGKGFVARTSLARIAALLMSRQATTPDTGIAPAHDEDFGSVEMTSWGPARRVLPPLVLEGAPLHWSRPAEPLGTSPPQWASHA